MRTKLWGGIGMFASIAAGMGAANAADLAVKAPVYKAPPVYVSDWAGFYLGVAGGGGFGSTSFNTAAWPDNAKPSGGIFGGYAGYNWQYGSWVTGFEIDFSGADIKTSSTDFGQKTDELASARFRLGYTVLPNLLAYGTAGGGYGHTTLTASNPFAGPFNGLQASNDQFGWVAGAGLEYKVWGNFIARAEYLHYDFGNKTYDFGAAFGTPLPNVSETVDVVRGGLSYKF